MKFEIQQEEFLTLLQKVIGAVERRQTLAVLSNFLFVAENNKITVTATDLEVELVAHMEIDVEQPGRVTIPARKLFDICRNLPAGQSIKVSVTENKATIISGRSRFSLSVLPAEDYPRIEISELPNKVVLSQTRLKKLIDKTAFAMANQDVRYYLNGMLLELGEGKVRAVTTDGHRLAYMEETDVEVEGEVQVIVPRKGVSELQRLLDANDDMVEVRLDENHISFSLSDLQLTSKLIDGRFPDYNRVIPVAGDKELNVDAQTFRQALVRTSILSNDKYKGVRMNMKAGLLTLQAHNPENEEAVEELEVNYVGDAVEVGFNVNYLLDVINIIESSEFSATFRDANSSCLIEESGEVKTKYVVMPMRL